MEKRGDSRGSAGCGFPRTAMRPRRGSRFAGTRPAGRWLVACGLAAAAAVALAGVAFATASIRAPILAGSWYPASPAALRDSVRAYLDEAETVSGVKASADGGSPVALLVPHAGYAFSGRTAALAFALVRGRSYDRVILLVPSHRASFRGGALPDADAFATPLGDCPVDRDAVASLARDSDFAIEPRAHATEHAVEIELPFLQVALAPGFRIVPIVVGAVDSEALERMREAIEPLLGPRTLLVISSDFTHYGPDYGYTPFPAEEAPARLRALDEGAIETILEISPNRFDSYAQRTGITICGAEPIRLALALLQGEGTRAVRLGTARSGEMLSDWTNSVSYVSIAFHSTKEDGRGGRGGAMPTPHEDPPHEDPMSQQRSQQREMLDAPERTFLLDLARRTVTAAVRGAPLPDAQAPAELTGSPILRSPRGVFVTLTERERLRGCIGSIAATDPLIEAVIHQAVNASLRDPRFLPVSESELGRISIEISVLTPLREVSDARAIEIGRHGVLLTKRGRSAVFLPQVAPEQGWDRDTMLRELCHKAGLSPDDWRSGARLQVFEAQVFSEEDARREDP